MTEKQFNETEDLTKLFWWITSQGYAMYISPNNIFNNREYKGYYIHIQKTNTLSIIKESFFVNEEEKLLMAYRIKNAFCILQLKNKVS